MKRVLCILLCALLLTSCHPAPGGTDSSTSVTSNASLSTSSHASASSSRTSSSATSKPPPAPAAIEPPDCSIDEVKKITNGRALFDLPAPGAFNFEPSEYVPHRILALTETTALLGVPAERTIREQPDEETLFLVDLAAGTMRSIGTFETRFGDTNASVTMGDFVYLPLVSPSRPGHATTLRNVDLRDGSVADLGGAYGESFVALDKLSDTQFVMSYTDYTFAPGDLSRTQPTEMSSIVTVYDTQAQQTRELWRESMGYAGDEANGTSIWDVHAIDNRVHLLLCHQETTSPMYTITYELLTLSASGKVVERVNLAGVIEDGPYGMGINNFLVYGDYLITAWKIAQRKGSGYEALYNEDPWQFEPVFQNVTSSEHDPLVYFIWEGARLYAFDTRDGHIIAYDIDFGDPECPDVLYVDFDDAGNLLLLMWHNEMGAASVLRYYHVKADDIA